MAQFILKINLGNDAMRTSRDISEALQKVSLKIRGDSLHYLELMSPFEIIDENGNQCGIWHIE